MAARAGEDDDDDGLGVKYQLLVHPKDAHVLDTPPYSPAPSVEVVDMTEDPSSLLYSWRVGLLLTLFVVFAVINAVAAKLMQNAFGTRYLFFREQLTNLAYDIYATIVVLYKVWYTSDITAEQQAYPLWVFAGLGFLDGLSDFLNSVGGVNTPGQYQVLIMQLIIPMAMAVSAALLHTSYTWQRLSGATVVVAGVLLAVVPGLNAHSGGAKPLSVVIFVSNVVPKAFSTVLKERILKRHRMDVFWLTCILSWFQLGIIWAFVPLQSLPSFGGVSLSEIPSVFRDGARCLTGDTSIVVYNNGVPQGHCDLAAPAVTALYSLSGFIAAALQLMVIKQGSAVLMVIVQALTLPLSNLAFTSAALVGHRNKEPFSWWDVGGLIVVLIGFGLFHSKNVRAKPT